MKKLQNIIHRYISIANVIDTLRHRQLALLDPATWDDRNDRYFMELYRRARGNGGLYAVCAATCLETYHHWKVFSASADGACIELYRQPLEKALANVAGARFGEMEYLTLDSVESLTPHDLSSLPYIKRYAFAAEMEYRIIVETGEPQQPVVWLPMPLSWIAGIRLNPWLPERVAQSVATTIREIDGCHKLKVVRSHLIENKRWKNAGDAVVRNQRNRA